jgi:3-oxoacyl-[acyl-carrier protein] reductase
MDRLKGRRAVVTASGGKMGGNIAVRLADEGADVVLNDRIPGATAPYAERIRQLGCDVVEVEADVTTRSGAEAVIGAAVDRWGGVDILVNGVGGVVHGRYTNDLLEINDDHWDATLLLNLRATFVCTQLAVPGMIERRMGKVVNIASTAWSGGVSPYAVAKAGVVSFTRGLANELARFDINVNAVAPGATRTRVEFGEETIARIPLGRLNEPVDIANAVVFLVSDDARNISGHLLTVSGGANPSL